MRIIVVSGASGTDETTLQGAVGMSVMSLAKAAGLVPGECEGSLACATCHVIVDPVWAAKLEAPNEDEEAMLDTVFDLRPTSRLSCQIRLTPALDGIRVSLP